MIYLDHAATTPVRPEAAAAAAACWQSQAGNPSSIHQAGRAARGSVEAARSRLAAFVGCHARELVFTSGGTESVQAALVGSWLARPERRHVVTAATEHHAVLHTCDLLRQLGVDVTVLSTDPTGRVDVDAVCGALRPDTLLVSVMRVNNELGTVTDTGALADAVHRSDPHVLVHSDMVQALAAERLNLRELGVDLASFSAHKVGGPSGVGALYVRTGTPWTSVLKGGAQERGLRAGTENVAGIAGFGAAVGWLADHWQAHEAALRSRGLRLRRGLERMDGVVVNSPPDAVPGIVNARFVGIRSDILLMRLDLEGICASAGSACTAGSLEPSHVLTACGMSEEAVRESVRFSLSDSTTEAEIDTTLAVLTRLVTSLRRPHPASSGPGFPARPCVD
ncbi:MAG: cysteine desulfurase [Alicyclobacillus sp.]|nr:cysteine desulfurase [Alicyclobacillus sp.]